MSIYYIPNVRDNHRKACKREMCEEFSIMAFPSTVEAAPIHHTQGATPM